MSDRTEALHAKKDAALKELCAVHFMLVAYEMRGEPSENGQLSDLIQRRLKALDKLFHILLALDWVRGASKAERARILKNIQDVEAIEAAEAAAAA